jgi:CO/xanthine dehydrogenase FAD-binding subunit
MDLTTVSELLTLTESGGFLDRDGFDHWREGDAWLAGGSWLFSEPQPGLRRLLDLTSLGWEPLVADDDGLEIAATGTIAALSRWVPPPEWPAGGLIARCCRYLLASFKVWNTATVGGNLCLALPAGSMTALAVALNGSCLLQGLDGTARTVAAEHFVTGDRRTVLRPGEYLRSIHLPAAALGGTYAVRQFSLTSLGRSAVLAIAVLEADRRSFSVTITAATTRPVQLKFDGVPTGWRLAREIDRRIPDQLYHDDLHGSVEWRRHLTYRLADQVRAELEPAGA